MSVDVQCYLRPTGCDRCVLDHRALVVIDQDSGTDYLCPSCASRLAMEILEAAEKAGKMDDFNDGDLRSTSDWFAGTR